MMLNLSTILDVEITIENSGVVEWEWGGDASLDGFTDWLYRHGDEEASFNKNLRKYLKEMRENPYD